VFKGRLQIVQEVVFRVVRQPKKPPHAVQGVRGHAVHGHRTSAVTGRVAAHPVGDDKQLALGLPEEPRLIFVSQIRLMDAKRFVKIGNEKPIFVHLSRSSHFAKAARIYLHHHNSSLLYANH
jgi:hypothetical protein